jgi:probable HAF family extracellular repeat protein
MILSVTNTVTLYRSIARLSPRVDVRVYVMILFGVFCIFSTATARAAATFPPLGHFGGTDSKAYDVSADGSVVVGFVYDASGFPSGLFRWTAGETVVLPGDFAQSPPAVSADGSVVVGQYNSPNGEEAFRWTAGGDLELLGDLAGEPLRSAAFDVSADGRVVVGVGFRDYGSAEAFRWTQASGMVGLGDLPGGDMNSIASGVSTDGAVVVGAGNGAYLQPFRWTAQTGMVGLNALLAGGLVRVSADGSAIAGTLYWLPPPGSIHPQQEAFRWTESEGLVRLASLTPGRLASVANNLSADGPVIVGTDGAEFVARAFYWSGGMTDLQKALISAGATNLDGWQLTEAWGVSSDNLTVVGTGSYEGHVQAWMATIPEPSTWALLVAACGVAVVIRKRQLTKVTI